MADILFSGANIFDGSGAAAFNGDVLVSGNRIAKVARGGKLGQHGATVVDCRGCTLMPGLTEGHGHISYTNASLAREMGTVPPEDHALLTARHAKLMLESGFTSVFSAASAKPRLEIAVRNEINAGHIPGPRLRAASPELVATGGLGDERQLHLDHSSFAVVADGPWEVRKAVRTFIREGVDTIKLNISGDNFTRPGFSPRLSYTEEEVAAAADQCHEWGTWLACHARAAAAVKLALKYRFRVIYHCDYADAETLDLLESHKDEIFLAPAIGIIYTTAYEAAAWGITPAVAARMDMLETLEKCSAVYHELRKRGLRVVPGGDYGFAWNPIGTNARDLEHFVKLFGYSAREALKCATQWGGELMGMGDELGQVQPGFLADLLLVDGDPTEDVALLQDRERLLMIMKDGVFHKAPAPERAMRRVA